MAGSHGFAKVSTGWRAFFWIAAAFNFVIGLAGFAGESQGTTELIVSLLVFSFGILYAFTASDPLRYGPALWAGVIGKLGVVVLLGIPTWTGGGDPLVGTVVAGDLVFALGFLWFLMSHRGRY